MYGTAKRKPVIAIDYDDTISKLPLFFKQIIGNWKHAIDFHIVTYRDKNAYNDELRELEKLTEHSVVFTSTKAKIDHFEADIWIDDMPLSINCDWKSTGYKIADSQRQEMFKKVCRVKDFATSCHNVMPFEDMKDEYKFCPYCGGALIIS